MHSNVYTAAVIGLDCTLVEVEADTSQALPGIFIVGLPDKAVDESRERVRSAIKNSDLQMPRTKVTINLAPADLKKEGPAYDLPIAMSILLLARQIPVIPRWQERLFLGELALDGSVRSVPGVLSVCLAARHHGVTTVYVPTANAPEAALVQGVVVVPVANLAQLVAHLRGQTLIDAYQPDPETLEPARIASQFDMAFIRGQEHAKRAMEIAAAGRHNILFIGPPGSGKTMLARTMSSILPALTRDEALEVTRIYSTIGLLPADQPLVRERPFRSPHHTASGVALVGGGAWPKPGEISLAHRGVLFLDELPEFQRAVLENLRQPLEDGVVTVSRAAGTIQFPAQFTLVAAMNPCPCGYLTDPDHGCTCVSGQVQKYQKKISGPLLDRIDLHVDVPKVKIEKLTTDALAEHSDSIRSRVETAWQRQQQRFVGLRICANAEMSSRQTKEFCQIDERTLELLRSAVKQLGLSARSYFRILKLARTIADLDDAQPITYAHVAEALQYRPKVEG